MKPRNDHVLEVHPFTSFINVHCRPTCESRYNSHRISASNIIIPDYLEHKDIVKYPPPLYCFEWHELSTHEQKSALKELQTIDRGNLHSLLEARAGKILPKSNRSYCKDHPLECDRGIKCIRRTSKKASKPCR